MDWSTGPKKSAPAANGRTSLASTLIEPRPASLSTKDALLGVLICTGLLAVAVLLALAVEHFMEVQNVMLVFLPVVLYAAVHYGFWMALGFSVLSIASTAYFLSDPRWSLAAHDPENVWAIVFFMFVSAFTSTIAAQLRHRTEALRRALLLEETDKLRTALLTSISHDLRTPLASILGNISSLQQYGQLYDERTRNEMLALAEAETVRLSRFVDNLLHMTRIDARALRPSADMLDISDLVGSALKRTEKLLQQHKVKTEIDPELPMIPLDFVLAEHVLTNLLDNAAKYSPPGSLIDIKAGFRGDRIVLQVQDEGPGIPPEDLPRIFERFFRANVADQRRAGAGLGLAICKGFVEAMGGTIRAANREDRSGARFTIVWPTILAAERIV